MTIDQINQLGPGQPFVFRIGNAVTNLKVKLNDGHTLHADVVGGPRDGTQMTWHLDGLVQINEISSS